MNMNVLSTVRDELERLAPGSIVTYKDFDVPKTAVPTLVKAFSTFYKQGILGRITKGVYYKPRTSEFGPLKPPTTDLIERLLREQKNQVAYLTGVNTYNALWLTTQLSTEYVIATDRPRTPIKIGGTVIRFVLARLQQAPSSWLLAQILDAIQDIKEIPDMSPTQAAKILLQHVRELGSEQRKELARLALAYTPAIRALLGLLLEQLGEIDSAKSLQETLNPLSIYKLRLDMSQFPTTLPWNIV